MNFYTNMLCACVREKKADNDQLIILFINARSLWSRSNMKYKSYGRYSHYMEIDTKL